MQGLQSYAEYWISFDRQHACVERMYRCLCYMYMLYAIHKSSQSEIFFKIGVPKKYAKFLKNTSEQVHFLVELYAQSLNSSLVFSKNLASILNSWTACILKNKSRWLTNSKKPFRSNKKIIYVSNSLHVCCYVSNSLHVCCCNERRQKELSWETFSASQVWRLLELIQLAKIFEINKVLNACSIYFTLTSGIAGRRLLVCVKKQWNGELFEIYFYWTSIVMIGMNKSQVLHSCRWDLNLNLEIFRQT